MRVAIIGATGMLGRPVTHELTEAGFNVRIIARDVNRTRLLFPENDVVPGDLRNRDSLLTALIGVDVVYLNLSVKQIERPNTLVFGVLLIYRLSSCAIRA
jgi:uncharacterized protein YbjT (DUF2867 family)